ncbi:MAG: putative lipoprotein NlpC [Acidobacteriaceae bacterium]|jgi:hypothetical protein
MMGSFKQAALFVLLASLLSQPALARRKPHDEAVETKHLKSALLNSEEGATIVDTAFERRFRSAQDCSHFVHSVYDRAGYHFAYAPTSDLYAGIPEFHYVKHPQPGDLVVWRGHAGIVTDPEQHEFFSVLSTGLRMDFYDSRYWKHRGRPRFYRYRKPAASFEE